MQSLLFKAVHVYPRVEDSRTAAQPSDAGVFSACYNIFLSWSVSNLFKGQLQKWEGKDMRK